MKTKNQNKLIPDYAIVVYSEKGTPKYLEKGNFVLGKKNQYTLSGLRPFLDDELRNLQKMAVEGKGLYMDGQVPKKLLYFNTHPSNAIILWHEKAGKRFLNFKEKELQKEYDVPDTIFFMHNSDIYIYLVKRKDALNIDFDTMLYQSHYYNVWPSNALCIGSGYKPNIDNSGINEMINKISKDFWEGSYFTHPNHSHAEIEEIWKKNNGKYPESKWMAAEKIKSLLSRFVQT